MTTILARPMLSSLKAALRGTPVACLLGPRQSGKMTLSRTEAERRRRGAMTAGELRQRYQEIGGDEARSRSREELIRRIPTD